MSTLTDRIVMVLTGTGDGVERPGSRRRFLWRAAKGSAALAGASILSKVAGQGAAAGDNSVQYTCPGCGACSRIVKRRDPAYNCTCTKTYYPCVSQHGTCVGEPACAWDRSYRCDC